MKGATQIDEKLGTSRRKSSGQRSKPTTVPVAVKSRGSKSLVQRFKLFSKRVELARKVYHSLNGFTVLAAWYFGVEGSTALHYVFLFLLFSCAVEFARLKCSKRFNSFVNVALKPFMRVKEQNGISGNTWFLLGASLVLYSFPLDVASISIVFLAYCDPLASLVGVTLGKRYPIYRFSNNKTVCGMLGGVVAGIVTAFIFFSYFAPIRWHDVSLKSPLENTLILPVSLLSIISGSAAGIIETVVHIPNVDDNFVLPVFSALFLSALHKLTQIYSL